MYQWIRPKCQGLTPFWTDPSAAFDDISSSAYHQFIAKPRCERQVLGEFCEDAKSVSVYNHVLIPAQSNSY